MASLRKPRLSIRGEKLANVLLLACCYQEVSVRQTARYTLWSSREVGISVRASCLALSPFLSHCNMDAPRLTFQWWRYYGRRHRVSGNGRLRRPPDVARPETPTKTYSSGSATWRGWGPKSTHSPPGQLPI